MRNGEIKGSSRAKRLSEQLILWEAPPLSLFLWTLSLLRSLSRRFWWFGPMVITFYHSVGIVWRCLSLLTLSILFFSTGLMLNQTVSLVGTGVDWGCFSLFIVISYLSSRWGRVRNEHAISCEIPSVDRGNGCAVLMCPARGMPLCGGGGATFAQPMHLISASSDVS